jgi:hypothetical protein
MMTKMEGPDNYPDREGLAVARVLGERGGDPAACVPAFRSLWVKPNRADLAVIASVTRPSLWRLGPSKLIECVAAGRKRLVFTEKLDYLAGPVEAKGLSPW